MTNNGAIKITAKWAAIIIGIIISAFVAAKGYGNLESRAEAARELAVTNQASVKEIAMLTQERINRLEAAMVRVETKVDMVLAEQRKGE